MVRRRLRRGPDYEENFNIDLGLKDWTEDDDYTKLTDVILLSDHTKNPFVLAVLDYTKNPFVLEN